jgi:DNA-binding transcriptional MerR regulator
MKTRITIGELSKLYNISTQTLRFYDREGLFKPLYIDDNNGYRYYGIEQFALLDVIIFLRELGLSIEEIKSYMGRRDLDSFVALLEEKKNSLIKEINRLQQRKDSIEEKVQLIKSYKDSNINGEIQLKECEQRKFIHMNMENNMDKAKFEYGLKELSSYIKDEAILFRAIIALSIDKRDLDENTYGNWKELAFIFDNNVKLHSTCDILPEGLYASVMYHGPYDKGRWHFYNLLAWIKDNGFNAMGDAVVLNITEAAFSGKEEEYITEIQIPVKKSLTLYLL